MPIGGFIKGLIPGSGKELERLVAQLNNRDPAINGVADVHLSRNTKLPSAELDKISAAVATHGQITKMNFTNLVVDNDNVASTQRIIAAAGSTLQQLSFEKCVIAAHLPTLLVNNRAPRISRLLIHESLIDDRAATAVLAGIIRTAIPSLQALSLRNNPLGCAGAAAILRAIAVRAPSTPVINIVDLRQTKLAPDPSAAAFGAAYAGLPRPIMSSAMANGSVSGTGTHTAYGTRVAVESTPLHATVLRKPHGASSRSAGAAAAVEALGGVAGITNDGWMYRAGAAPPHHHHAHPTITGSIRNQSFSGVQPTAGAPYPVGGGVVCVPGPACEPPGAPVLPAAELRTCDFEGTSVIIADEGEAGHDRDVVAVPVVAGSDGWRRVDDGDDGWRPRDAGSEDDRTRSSRRRDSPRGDSSYCSDRDRHRNGSYYSDRDRHRSPRRERRDRYRDSRRDGSSYRGSDRSHRSDDGRYDSRYDGGRRSHCERRDRARDGRRRRDGSDSGSSGRDRHDAHGSVASGRSGSVSRHGHGSRGGAAAPAGGRSSSVTSPRIGGGAAGGRPPLSIRVTDSAERGSMTGSVTGGRANVIGDRHCSREASPDAGGGSVVVAPLRPHGAAGGASSAASGPDLLSSPVQHPADHCVDEAFPASPASLHGPEAQRVCFHKPPPPVGGLGDDLLVPMWAPRTGPLLWTVDVARPHESAYGAYAYTPTAVHVDIDRSVDGQEGPDGVEVDPTVKRLLVSTAVRSIMGSVKCGRGPEVRHAEGRAAVGGVEVPLHPAHDGDGAVGVTYDAAEGNAIHVAVVVPREMEPLEAPITVAIVHPASGRVVGSATAEPYRDGGDAPPEGLVRGWNVRPVPAAVLASVPGGPGDVLRPAYEAVVPWGEGGGMGDGWVGSVYVARTVARWHDIERVINDRAAGDNATVSIVVSAKAADCDPLGTTTVRGAQPTSVPLAGPSAAVSISRSSDVPAVCGGDDEGDHDHGAAIAPLAPTGAGVIREARPPSREELESAEVAQLLRRRERYTPVADPPRPVLRAADVLVRQRAQHALVELDTLAPRNVEQLQHLACLASVNCGTGPAFMNTVGPRGTREWGVGILARRPSDQALLTAQLKELRRLEQGEDEGAFMMGGGDDAGDDDDDDDVHGHHHHHHGGFGGHALASQWGFGWDAGRADAPLNRFVRGRSNAGINTAAAGGAAPDGGDATWYAMRAAPPSGRGAWGADATLGTGRLVDPSAEAAEALGLGERSVTTAGDLPAFGPSRRRGGSPAGAERGGGAGRRAAADGGASGVVGRMDDTAIYRSGEYLGTARGVAGGDDSFAHPPAAFAAPAGATLPSPLGPPAAPRRAPRRGGSMDTSQLVSTEAVVASVGVDLVAINARKAARARAKQRKTIERDGDESSDVDPALWAPERHVERGVSAADAALRQQAAYALPHPTTRMGGRRARAVPAAEVPPPSGPVGHFVSADGGHQATSVAHFAPIDQDTNVWIPTSLAAHGSPMRVSTAPLDPPLSAEGYPSYPIYKPMSNHHHHLPPPTHSHGHRASIPNTPSHVVPSVAPSTASVVSPGSRVPPSVAPQGGGSPSHRAQAPYPHAHAHVHTQQVHTHVHPVYPYVHDHTFATGQAGHGWVAATGQSHDAAVVAAGERSYQGGSSYRAGSGSGGGRW